MHSKITFNILPMKLRADYIPLTESTVLTSITIQFENKDLNFQAKDGVQKATVNLYGRITTLSRRWSTGSRIPLLSNPLRDASEGDERPKHLL